MDGGVDELGKLVIGIDAIRRGAVREMGRGETLVTVGKVNTTDETENRSLKLDASFHNF